MSRRIRCSLLFCVGPRPRQPCASELDPVWFHSTADRMCLKLFSCDDQQNQNNGDSIDSHFIVKTTPGPWPCRVECLELVVLVLRTSKCPFGFAWMPSSRCSDARWDITLMHFWTIPENLGAETSIHGPQLPGVQPG